MEPFETDQSFDVDDGLPDQYYDIFSDPPPQQTKNVPPNHQPVYKPSNVPSGCSGPLPSFPPPPPASMYSSFRTLDEACSICKSLTDINGCYICLPINFIASIRNDKRRQPIPGYIIHH